jgi:hypothetical protein
LSGDFPHIVTVRETLDAHFEPFVALREGQHDSLGEHDSIADI